MLFKIFENESVSGANGLLFLIETSVFAICTNFLTSKKNKIVPYHNVSYSTKAEFI